MKTVPEQHWETIEFEGDSRWDLVQRIIESPHLSGSARLKDFLLHVSACAIRGDPDCATEQQIGIQVFQRPPGFNSSEDSIVRSQARLLRKKLAAYFKEEGATEPILIEIPKGHYLPVFRPSPQTNKDSQPETTEDSHSTSPVLKSAIMAATKKQRGWITVASLGLALLLCFSLFVTSNLQKQVRSTRPIKQLWAPFLVGDPPLVIYSNALFVGDAKNGMRYAATDGSDERATNLVDNYTGIGELISVHELTRLFDNQHSEFLLKRSPLVTWDEARSRNLIFIGSIAENGSLKSLPSTQDFTLTASANDAGVINHHPRLGEPAVYLRPEHPLTKDYSVIALLPAVQPDHKMFVFSGLTTLGTQAAVEYALQPETVTELLRQVTIDHKIHNFEALLEVNIRGGVPLQPRLLSIRVH
ncbi:MAG TPA: hypothetical protein VNU92_10340 [Edaphobacter sp.]|jgi:hypothetical protein|nr:hypothetical protein [Edaphobacter sp.]